MLHNLFFLLAFLTWGAVELFVQVRDRHLLDKSKDNNTFQEVLILSAFTLFSCLFVRFIFPQLQVVGLANEKYILYLGGLIILAGASLRFWSVQTLGMFFRRTVMIQKEHQLIEKGPYRFLRHPSYTGAYLGIIGFSLGANNWLSLLVGIGLGFFCFWHRIQVEEKVLAAHFGEKFQKYSRHTNKLIPFIW